MFVVCMIDLNQFYKSKTGCKIRTLISAWEWLSLQGTLSAGTAICLLTRKIRSLWGLRTRAGPATNRTF